ncbi:MAG: MaoC family dehydratase [Pseudohongiellaceae bacterium]
MANAVPSEKLKDYVGKEVGVTDWVEITQQRINQFADATDDHQYIHVDPERAAETMFGTTIAHGFLTLSLMTMFSGMGGGIKLEDTVMAVNYGLNKVRFINPVKVGQRVRARFVLVSAEQKVTKRFLIKHNVTIEIEGEDKPALIAEWLGMSMVA